MAAKKNNQKNSTKSPIIEFDYQNSTYQIVPENGKVYSHWVEIEKAKEFMVYAAWKNSQQFA